MFSPNEFVFFVDSVVEVSHLLSVLVSYFCAFLICLQVCVYIFLVKGVKKNYLCKA